MEKLSFIPVMGTEEKILAQDRYEGHVYFATDTGRIYMDSMDESKLLMGGSSGIHYGQHVHTDTPAEEQEDFEFLLSEIEDTGSSPNEDDLILNIPDGCFYRIIEIEETEEETILHVRKLTIAGSGTGGGGGGGQVGGSGGITWITTSPATAIYNKDFAIELNLTAVDAMGQPTEGHEFVLKAERREGGTPTTIVAQGALDQGYNSIEVGKYLNEVGTWRVRVEASLEIGGTAPITYNKTFTVTVTTISLTWDYDQATINNAEEDFTFSDWRFIGTGEEKKLHIIFDNYNELDPVRLTNNATTLNYSISPLEKGLTHGVHKVEIYGTLKINGENIKTDSIYKNIIFYEEEQETTLISCNLFDTNLTQYTTTTIPIVIYSPKNTEEGSATIVLMEEDREIATWTNRKNGVTYEWLYTPVNAGENITLTIKCDNEEAVLVVNVASLNIDNDEVEGYSFRFKTSEMADNEAIQNWATANGSTFSERFDWNNGGIRSEVDEKGYNRQYLLIKKGDYIEMNTKPFEKSASENGLSMKIIFKTLRCRDYDAQFLTCADSVEAVYPDTSNTVDIEIVSDSLAYSDSAVVSNSKPALDPNNTNYIAYNSTDTAVLDILNNKYISYNDEVYFFTYRIDPNNNNEIAITINPTYVSEDSFVGIKMQAQQTKFACLSTAINIPYYEESYIELELDIAKKKSDKGFKGYYVKPWLDGVPCGITLYGLRDTISQTNPQKVKIGSDECDVCLYLFKVYNKSLTDEEHLENFIADALSGQEMLDRFNRNDILNTELTQQYQTPIIDYTKLSEKNPNCHVHLYSIERMTKTKKDKVGVYSYSQYLDGNRILKTTDPIGIEEGGVITDNSRCPARIKVQGTSSANYGIAAFNIDSDFTQTNLKNEENCSLLDIDNNPLPDGWSMDKTAIPCTYFCTKVNVASAEGANNALNQEWYNYHQPYIGAARQQNYDEYGNLKEGPLYRDTMQFQPGVVFIKDWNQITEGEYSTDNNLFKELGTDYLANPFYKMYSIGCMGNSKDNVHVFHTKTECCIENNDNQLPGQWMTITPGTIKYEAYGAEQTTYCDLDNLTQKISFTNPESGATVIKSARELWLESLNDVYGFRYPDGIKEVEKMTDINPSTGNPYSEDMIEGWFDFVHWISRSDPMPRYELVELLSKEEFTTSRQTLGILYIKQNLDDDNIEYIIADSYNENISEYYYETVHVHGPDGKKLPEPVVFDAYTFTDEKHSKTLLGLKVSAYAGTYTHDTPEYRMAKMLSECEQHLVMDSIVYHYLFIERHTMIDNVAKNTFWSSSDYKHWDLTKNYDNDTADGNDNQGKLTLTYGYEVGDVSEAGDYIFNAGHSVWLHFIRKLPTVCRYMYQILHQKTSAWDASNYLNEFKVWQQSIPERCWIEDYYRKYIRPWEIYNDGSFLPRMEGGLKTHQREQYERYQQSYLGSKYQTDTETKLVIRPNTGNNLVTARLTFQLYADGYINMAVGKGQEINKSFRVKRNQPYTWQETANYNNATFQIYNPNNLQSIGDETYEAYVDEKYVSDSLGRYNIEDFSGIGNCTKLRKLVFSTKKDVEKNFKTTGLESIELNGANMLEELYICGFSPVDKTSLNLSDNESMIYVDARYSNFGEVNIADGAPLKTLLLEAPTILSMSNLLDFEEYYSANKATLNMLELNNIDNNEVNSRDLVMDSLEATNSQLNYYSLLSVKWNINDASEIDDSNSSILDLDKLIELGNKKNLNLPNSLTGTLTIAAEAYNGTNSLAMYEKYAHKDVYPNLDINFLGESAKLYTVKVVDGNGLTIWNRKVSPGATLSDTFFVGEENFIPSSGVLDLSKITKMDTSEITYTKTGTWNIYNADTNELIAEQVTSDDNGYPIYNNVINSNITIEHYFKEDVRYYHLRFFDEDRTTILAEFKGDGSETGYGKITYKTPLGNIISQILTIPYKDDSALPLKSTYNHIGYHYIQDSSSPLPETYQVINDADFYPIFELVDDITLMTPHYEYFNIVKAETDYSEPNVPILDSDVKFSGYVLSPKMTLKGKIVLPLIDSNGNNIIRISGFKNQSQITHIFFDNAKQVNHKFEIDSNCFEGTSTEKPLGLKYFEFSNNNLGMIRSFAFRYAGLDASLYDGIIEFGNQLIYIDESGLNQAFIKNTTSDLTIKQIYLPSSLVFINTNGFTFNKGLVGYNVIIGGPKYSSLSKLKMSDTGPCLVNNDDQHYEKITFYTSNTNYTADNPSVVATFTHSGTSKPPVFEFIYTL